MPTAVIIALALLLLVLAIRHIQLNAQIRRLARLVKPEIGGSQPPQVRLLSDFGSMETLLAALEERFELHLLELGEFRRSDRELHRMVTNLSHDLRTPLTIILAHAENLAATYPHDPHAQRILSKGNELVGLIDRFFDLSKLESEETEFHLLTLDLSEQVRQAVLSAYDAIEEAGLEPEFLIPDEPVYVRANTLGLQRSLQNLITNAIKHGAQGSMIGVKSGAGPDGGWVTVWDKGTGIPASQIEHIFERTYTLDDSRNSRSSGLGLSIVKAFMKRMHGSVEVSSDPVQGTAFTLRLPFGDQK